MCDDGTMLSGPVRQLKMGGFYMDVVDSASIPGQHTYGSAVLSANLAGSENIAIAYSCVETTEPLGMEVSFESMDDNSRKSYYNMFLQWRKRARLRDTQEA
jgi:hypothetical protein